MVMRRTAVWLLAWVALVGLAGSVRAQQVPANSNLDYQTNEPSYENGNAPFSEANPTSWAKLLPFHSLGVEPTARPFGPAETSNYGNGPRPHVGYFASLERLFWSLSAPKTGFIGSTTAPNPPQFVDDGFFLVPQIPSPFPDGPSVDNRFIGATGGWGNRWEVGYVDTDNYGLLISVLDHVSQNQYRTVDNPAIRFTDPTGILHAFARFNFPAVTNPNLPAFDTSLDVGVMPTMFDTLSMQNLTQLNGVEIMRFYRAPRLHHGAFLEYLYGVRWLQIYDSFTVIGQGNGANTEAYSFEAVSLVSGRTGVSNFTTSQNILDASNWNMRIFNNLVGPEVGLRWFRQQGRWVVSLEPRFLAAANFQNALLKSNTGTNRVANAGTDSNLINGYRGLGVNTHQYTTTFSPVGELRLNASFQATSNIGIKVGYTGMYVGNISRASNRINYDGPNLVDILDGNFHQTFFINGINFGVEINR